MMIRKGVITWCLTMGIALNMLGQNTVGLVDIEADRAEGYMLVYPDQQGTLFLLNSCGELVHSWVDETSVPGNGARLISNGSIMRTYVDEDGGNPFFTAGGTGEKVQIKDWDNTILWDHEISSLMECIHHDAEVLPNGNVLVIAWELKTMQEAWNAGRDTVGFGYSSLWPDKIMELQPVGVDQANVVWEWHAWDHLIQDVDPARMNYGVISEHPELVDINHLYTSNVNPDWLHTNSIDHNPELDQIMLSVPYFNEIWVIDHSTTSAEASGHSGGNSGKGGDLLYRWGNPMAYDRGEVSDQQLFFNHGAHWIGPGLSPDDSDHGKIMVFNNRVEPDVSAVDIIVPPIDAQGNYTLDGNSPFLPVEHEQRFATAVPTDFSSPGQGSAQKLSTGNVLVCSARQGWTFQLRPDSSIAWSYKIPMINGIPVAQGTDAMNGTIMFQAEWVPLDDPRIEGRDLSVTSFIELDPDPTFCQIVLSVEPSVVADPSMISILDHVLTLQSNEPLGAYTVYDITGRAVLSGVGRSNTEVIDLQGMSMGAYVLHSANKSFKFLLR